MKKYLLLLLPLLLSCHSTVLEPVNTGHVIFSISFTGNGHLTGIVKDRLNYPVKHFDEGLIQSPQYYEIDWDATDDEGQPVFEGLYTVTFFSDETRIDEHTFTLYNL